MGEVFIRVKVHGPLGSAEFPRILVDTGATHSMLERTLARSLGIRPEGTMEFDIVGGSVDMPVGVGLLEIQGRSFRVPVVLGDQNLVGLTTLETLRFAVDPLEGKLIPRRGILFPTPLAQSA